MTPSFRYLQNAKTRASDALQSLRAAFRGPAVLMYHRIADNPIDPWGLAVAPAAFEEHLIVLKKRRLVLPLTEFGRLHGIGRLPQAAVAITFDDGYACNARVALPLLHRHAVPATFFVATGLISSAEEFWWDALQRIVDQTTEASLELPLEGGGRRRSVSLGPPQSFDEASQWNAMLPAKNARQSAYLEMWRVLRGLSDRARRNGVASLHLQSRVPAQARATHRIMTTDELGAAAKSDFVEIGAHSVTHPALSALSRTEQQQEVQESRAFCQRLTGRTATAFAYPYGDFSDETVGVVKDAGLSIACSTVPHTVTRRSDSLRLPRLQVLNWTGEQLRQQLGKLTSDTV
jgi:peptidoglycan/xylan/chitin deacetylase (PgdA/CDA1 family)